MKNIKISNTSIIAVTICLLLLFVYGVIEIYNFTLESSKNSHQNKQLEIIKSAGLGIKSNIEYIISDLNLLAQINPVNDFERNVFLQKLWDEGIESVFKTDDSLNIISYEGEKLSTWVNAEIKESQNGLEPSADNTGKYYWLSKVKPKNLSSPQEQLILLLLVEQPQIQNNPDINRTTRFLGCVLNFDILIDKYISPHKLTENDFVWVLDGEGRLIYHPTHREMLLRSTKDLSDDCTDCHKSFEIQNKMLLGGSFTSEYFIEGEPRKIMACSPVNFYNQKWVLAISTYLPYVVEDVRNSFLIVFSLSGVFIIFLLILAYSAYNINVNRIRAEESQKHLEQVQNFQEKLNHAAKLASIGELVDSVAHEINTPTGIISSTADVLLLSECSKNNCSNDLNVIKDQTRRIGKYTKSLLRFSRRLPFLPELHDVSELIDECLFIINPKLRNNSIDVQKIIPAEFPKFVFDRGRLEQVIINLLNNAIDSVDKNGLITIKLDRYTKKDGDWILISIADNGKGIPSENLESIFEPFFSTKPITQGTGLGLSISKAIVERHEGKLQVKSDPSFGTEFLIDLPMRKKKSDNGK